MLQFTSNLHESLCNIRKQEMADCHVTPRVWAEHTHTATTWPGSWGQSQGEGQDFSLKAKAWGAKAKTKTLSSKAKAKVRPRPSWGVLKNPRGQLDWCMLKSTWSFRHVASGVIASHHYVRVRLCGCGCKIRGRWPKTMTHIVATPTPKFPRPHLSSSLYLSASVKYSVRHALAVSFAIWGSVFLIFPAYCCTLLLAARQHVEEY